MLGPDSRCFLFCSSHEMRFTALPWCKKHQPRVESVDDGGDEEVNEEEAEGGRVRHKWSSFFLRFI